MLQRLIGANGNAELLAGFGVFQRLGIQYTHNAHSLCRQCNDGFIAERIDHRQRTALLAQQGIGTH